MSSLAEIHQTPRDEAGVLTGLDHPGQVVQGGVHVGAADGLDQGTGDVVVLVAVAVVLHRGPVDRLLQRGQADLRLALVQRGPGGGLQRRQGTAGVTACDAQQVLLGVLGETDGLLQAARVGQGPPDQVPDVVVGEGFEGEEEERESRGRSPRSPGSRWWRRSG